MTVNYILGYFFYIDWRIDILEDKKIKIEDEVKSLYIHFPFCKHICNYCDFYKRVPSEAYNVSSFHNLFNEQDVVHERILSTRGLKLGGLETLYIGGGTPSLWGEEGARFLELFLRKKGLELNNKGEYTLEVNPGTWTDKVISRWLKAGINRFSVGIQSLDERFLPILDRVHTLHESFELLDYFKGVELDYSVDFMLGLPNSESLQRNVLEELDKILFYKPSHISLYILTTKESYIHQKSLPKDDWIAEEYLKVSNFLIERGFNHYEVSNFSLPGKESKHNLRYWSLDSVAALGPSGTGFLKGNNGGFRYKWNVHDSRVKEEVLSKREFELEKIYLSLRTFRGLNVSDLFGKDNDHALYSLIDEWRLKGYLSSLENERVSLSPKGFLLLDSIMDDLFREKIV